MLSVYFIIQVGENVLTMSILVALLVIAIDGFQRDHKIRLLIFHYFYH